jgi:hypothetical protein
MIDLSRVRRLVRDNGPSFAVDVIVNFVLPYAIYSYASPRIGDVHALMVSSGPPIVLSIVAFIRQRRVDALSLLVLGGIALSLLAFIGSGDARFLQLREKLVTGVVGLVFLISAAVGRPLIYEIARAGALRKASPEAARMEALRDDPMFRRSMMVMTLVWGFGLIIDVAIASFLVFALTIKQYLIVNPFLGYTMMGCLGLWTFWYARRRRTMGDAARAAQGAARAAAP